MEKLQKLKNIEFLRFIFILLIIYCHLPIVMSIFPDIKLYSFISTHAKFATMAVDFFFILSGFFLKYTMDTQMDTFDFIKKKINRLWAVVAFAAVCYICLNFFNIDSYGSNVYNTLFSFFFVDNIGITLHHCGPSWYVSVLVLVSLFYFYMYKALPEKVVNLIIGVLVWFSYSVTINADQGDIIRNIETYNNFLCMGLLRGIGAIGLGIFLYYLYERYRNITNEENKITYTILEIGLLGWIIYAMVLTPKHIHNSMVFIIAFLMLIWLFLIKRGYLSKILDNNISVFLGKYTYSIFLTHIVIIYLLRGTVWTKSNIFIQNYPILTLILLYFVCFSVGVITYHSIEKPTGKIFDKLGFIKYYISIFAFLLILSSIFGHNVTHKTLNADTVYKFNTNYKNIIINGVSDVENWGRWSNDDKVDMKFYIPERQDIYIKFETDPFLNEVVKKQEVGIYCKEQLLGTWKYELNKKVPSTELIVPQSCVKKNGKVRLTFKILNPKSPEELGISKDSRRLGIGFETMTLKFEK